MEDKEQNLVISANSIKVETNIDIGDTQEAPRDGQVHQHEEAMEVDNDDEEEENEQCSEEDGIESSQSTQPKRTVTEDDVIRLNEDRWPNVNGVFDAEGEWHDWNNITFSYSYDNSELIILPYTVCIVNLSGQQIATETSST